MPTPYDSYREPNYNPDAIDPATTTDDSARRAAKPRAKAASSHRTAAHRQPGTISRFLTDKRTKLVLGVIMMLTAVFFLLSMLSYFYYADEDQSRVLGNSVIQLADSATKVKNLGGPLGAHIGNTLINGWLGLGSFFIVYYIGMLGAKLLGLSKVSFWPLTFKCLILGITTSVVLGLIMFNSATVIVWGGQHGHYVNDFLIRTTSEFGAIAVSVTLLALVAAIYLNELTAMWVAWRRRITARRERRQAAIEERERRERELNSALENEPIDPTHDDPAMKPRTVPDDRPIIPGDSDDTTDDTEIADSDADDTLTPHAPELKPIVISGDGESPDLEVVTTTIEEAPAIRTDVYDPTAELSRFRFPSIESLTEHSTKTYTVDQQEQEENKNRILKVLDDFGIKISTIKATVGPTITLYEIVPAPGERIARIKRLEDDIALSLAALGIRIIAPIPGKGTIGIEVPNNDPQIVSMRSIIASRKYQECRYELPMAMGSTISNEVFIADLTKMPHLLVAGATGQGKSVGLNAIITSLLYKKHPAELKFVLIDPKMVEFSLYKKLEYHYLAKLPDEEDAIITDPNKVVATLNSLCVEMDNRYNLLSEANCRGIKEYNEKFTSKRLNPEKGHRYLPYIVIIVDEFADLIMTAGKEVETPICRIAQKARAVGMHIIIATQRPSTNVITGIIKANFPGRVAFRVSQMVDSKTILDRSGAHQLIGKGDMLISTNGALERVQCAFVDTPEVEAICNEIASQPGYPHAYVLPEYVPEAAGDFGGDGFSADRDPLFEEAARFIVQSGNTASTSSLQRRYSIGYNRAGKIMDQLEAAGIVGPASGAKPRVVLADTMSLESILSR